MTEKSPSAEALEIAERSAGRYQTTDLARCIDALCEQRVSDEAKRLVEIIKAIAKLYGDTAEKYDSPVEVEFDAGWRLACERIILHIRGAAKSPTESSPTTAEERIAAVEYRRWQATLEAKKAAITDFCGTCTTPTECMYGKCKKNAAKE